VPVVKARLASNRTNADPSALPHEVMLASRRSLDAVPLLLAMLVAAAMVVLLAHEVQRGRGP
jgi:hypothetical protein